MSPHSYLRFPHVSADLVSFVAEDDVWLAPLTGGRAWRVSNLGRPARGPRFTPDGRHLVWSVVVGEAAEVVTADVDGGGFRQLTHWGQPNTRVRGFTPDGEAVAVSSHGQADTRHTWARTVPLDGGMSRLLPYGPVDSLAWGTIVGDDRPLLIGSALSREQAHWKRYRGGTAGKLWLDRDGGGQFERFLPGLDGNLCDAAWAGGRIVFLSDHEGYGNVYSARPDGTELRRHTDHERYYARHLSTDGTRLVYEHAGTLMLLDSLDDEARPLEIFLGSAGTARRPYRLEPGRHLGTVAPDAAGGASVVETHGTLHLLQHRDGPSHAVEATPGVRARLGRMVDAGRVAFVADRDGEEALYVRELDPALRWPEGRGVASGEVPPVPSGGGQHDGGDAAGTQGRPSSVEPVSVAPAAEAEGALPQPVSAASVSGSGRAGAAAAAPDAARGGEAEPAGGTDRPGEDPASSQRDGDAPASAEATPAKTAGDRVEPGLRRIPLPAARTRVRSLETSPDGRWVGIGTESGALHLLELATGEWRELASTQFGAVEQLCFSPDSAWMAWVEPATGFEARSRIRLAPTASHAGDALDATDGRFHDHSPSFTPDGKYLAFLSERSFDPLYDTHGFDLGFPASTKPFLVALDDRTPSPFGPKVYTGPTVPEATPEAGAKEAAGEKVRGADKPRTGVVPEGLQERLVAVPAPQGRYGHLTAVEGALLWEVDESTGTTGDGRVPDQKGPALRLDRFDLAERKTTTLVPALDAYRVGADRTRLVYVNDGEVHAVPTAAPVEQDSPDAAAVDLSRVRVELHPALVWGQAFDEAWRLQRDFFWTPDMAGIDWEDVRERYHPLVARLGGHDDLVDLLWEVHGELGTSHAYVTPVPAPAAGRQGHLGAELVRRGEEWAVETVFPGESSDPQAVSPLSAPGVAVRAGDVVLAVDGQRVPHDGGPAALLGGAAGRTVELTIKEGPAGRTPGCLRRVAVVPIADERRLRYQHWVATNRRTVREASGGRYGYLHIPDMMADGWAQLHRDLDRETELDALVIDVRRNRGGHTSQLVAELIGRKVTAWTSARDIKVGTYPSTAPRGPVVVLADEWAGSDGDIITQVVKLRGIGPVVGTRTWGGVVGIDGLFELADGTKVTQPRYATWFAGGVGWSVENRGVDPDIEVPFPPHSHAAGEDPQLEQALGILREMSREIPTQRAPEHAGYPVLRPAPLPPRP